MLILAPYLQASAGPVPKEEAMKERTTSLSSVFTRGRKAVIQGLRGMSSYGEYAKLGLEKSKELTKLGYGYSLHVIRYSYERGKDGLYYVTIAKEQAIPVLYTTKNTAKNYTGNVANLPTVLPILAQTQWLNYLETLTTSAATNFDKALDAKYLQDALG